MNEWQTWMEGQNKQKVYPERIRTMWKAYGKTEGRTCKECARLYQKRYGRNYYKCELNNNTNGPGTDWRLGWQACGQFEKKEITE